MAARDTQRRRDGDVTRAWLARDGEVVAALDIARSHSARRRGLRARDGIEGAFLLRPCRHVHTFGMRFPIDVAFCAADGTVLRISRLAPRRVSPLVLGAAFAVEAAAGSFDRWSLAPGRRVEVVGDADAPLDAPPGTA